MTKKKLVIDDVPEFESNGTTPPDLDEGAASVVIVPPDVATASKSPPPNHDSVEGQYKKALNTLRCQARAGEPLELPDGMLMPDAKQGDVVVIDTWRGMTIIATCAGGKHWDVTVE